MGTKKANCAIVPASSNQAWFEYLNEQGNTANKCQGKRTVPVDRTTLEASSGNSRSYGGTHVTYIQHSI